MTSQFARTSLSIVTAWLMVAVVARSTSLLSQASSPKDNRSLVRMQTVFGRGPELHLLPNFGRVGTHVMVVGLGYPPHARVSVFYGEFQASFMPTPIASGMTSVNGTFRASFTVDCRFVALSTTHAFHPPRTCPLSPANPFRAVAVGGFVNHIFSHKLTSVEGFIVTG